MTQTLKQRVLDSGFWVTANYGVQQLLRLGSNLLLTRLLFPEAFGLMAIVQTIVLGINLLSDLGINTTIIQHKKGADPEFLNTAWTLQIMRGVVLFLVAIAVSGAVAKFYQQPMLMQILPVVAFGMLIQSFRSTKVIVANRALKIKHNTMIELGAYVLGLVITIFLAWKYHSVWAIVIGGLANSIASAWASHYLLPGMGNRFAWHPLSFLEIFGLSKWLFLNSILTFFSGEGNRLIVAKLLDVRMLGFYTLASMIAMMFWQMMTQLALKILLPAYSEIIRQHPERLPAALAKTRLYLIIPGYLIATVMVLWGREIINLIYDERYQGAGEMLILVSMGTFPMMIRGSYLGVLTAKGMVRANTVLQALTIVTQIGLMYVGHHYFGALGVVASFAVANWLLTAPYLAVYHHAGCWQPRMDIPLLLAALVFVIYRASILFS